MNSKSYCNKCKRFLDMAKFEMRTDRDCPYSYCKACCEKTPLYSRVLVNGDWVWTVERESREIDYPELGDRGYGRI
jgi:hypothetical protein